jgi:uncharacterized protein YecT (DUF1311 family)
MNNKYKRINRLNFLFLGVLIFMQSCKPSNNNVTKSEEEIVAEEDVVGIKYYEPDYSRLGYDEISFTGEGSQAEMNEEEGSNYKRAWNRMNIILDSIHILYNQKDVFSEEKQNISFFKSLEFSQKNWLAYYESLVELKYPKDELGGSANLMCETDYRTTLINQRIRDLNLWLMGTPQGEVCSGTQRLLDYSWGDIERSREK